MFQGPFRIIEQHLEKNFPHWLSTLYPRLYVDQPRYHSPKLVSRAIGLSMFESALAFRHAGRFDGSLLPSSGKILYTAVPDLIEKGMPMFFLAPDLLQAVVQTDFRDDVDWSELHLPYEAGVFVMPRGGLISPMKEEVAFIVWHREKIGPYPRPFPELPRCAVDTAGFSFTAFCPDGELADHGRGPVWYDSHLSAAFRTTMRFGNLFYGEGFSLVKDVTQRTLSIDLPLSEAESAFLEVIGVVVFGTLLALNARPELLTPQRLSHVSKSKGRKREHWTPNIIGKDYKIPGTPQGGTHASPRMHWRRGHFRQQPFGPGRKERKQIWLEPCLVGAETDE